MTESVHEFKEGLPVRLIPPARGINTLEETLRLVARLMSYNRLDTLDQRSTNCVVEIICPLMILNTELVFVGLVPATYSCQLFIRSLSESR